MLFFIKSYFVLSAYNIALILLLLGFLFVSFFTEHEDPAAPLHTDASIVYRGRGGAYQTRLGPITSCLPQPNVRVSCAATGWI